MITNFLLSYKIFASRQANCFAIASQHKYTEIYLEICFAINILLKQSIYYNIIYIIYLTSYSYLIKETIYNKKITKFNFLSNCFASLASLEKPKPKPNKWLRNIIFNIISKYKYILFILNMNYIIIIIIYWFKENNLIKLNNLIFIQIKNIIISKLNLIINHIYNLENIFNIKINILNYSISNCFAKNILLFIVINLTLFLLVILYLIYIINIEPSLNKKIIIKIIKQIQILNSIYNIFIIKLLNIYFSDYYIISNFFNFLNFIFINTINFSSGLLPIKDLGVIKIIFQNFNYQEDKFSSISTFPKLMSSDLVFKKEVVSLEGNVDSDIELHSNLSNSPTASSIAPQENLATEDINFNNFTDLRNEEKRNYLINKYENKGMTPTFYIISWLSDKIQNNTDGNKQNVDIFIDNYLNEILNLERDTQLKSFAFHREKPFLRHLIYKTPLEYPYVIPANNNMSEFEISELKDALIKSEE
jgi:hypothetical protein